MRDQGCISASPPRAGRASTHSTRPHSPPAVATTASRACARITAPPTTPPSRSIPMATGSRPIAASKPDTPGTRRAPMTPSGFLDALHAEGPAADREGKMDLYGWLVGSWELDVTRYLDDGSRRRISGAWHFGWALEGRAVQDVWIVAPRYGTTLRTYDPGIDAWHIQWTEPVSQSYSTMIGRRRGDDIVQDGKD